MHRLIAENPQASEIIFPYIGGEEVNDTPDYLHYRYCIDLRDRAEEDCRSKWPEVMSHLEVKVKPQRQQRNDKGEYKLRKPMPQQWWIHGEKRPGLYSAIADLERVIVVAQTSKYKSFAFMQGKYVFDQKLNVFSFSSYAHFALLQSSIHLHWAEFMGSSMKDDPVYTPTICFEPFPSLPHFSTINKILAPPSHILVTSITWGKNTITFEKRS